MDAASFTTPQSCPNTVPHIVVCAGDGKLGLLIAQVLALEAPGKVTLIGRHPHKLQQVSGLAYCIAISRGGDSSSQSQPQILSTAQEAGPHVSGAAGGDVPGEEPATANSRPGSAAAAESRATAHMDLLELERRYAGHFDLVIEATGASGGVRTALALTRPMGTLVLKTTVSVADAGSGPN